MRGILTFNIPKEEEEFRTALDGYMYRINLHDFDEHLRMTIKHGEKSGAEKKVYEEIRKVLNDMVMDYGVEI